MTETTDFNSKIIAEFRATGGKVGGPFAGSDILLLHHTGAHTGTERGKPARLPAGGGKLRGLRLEGGRAGQPAWYHNLLAHPDTTVEVGTEPLRVRARVAEPAERDVIWERQIQRAPHFAEYERKAAPREIPVVVLGRC